MWISLVAIFWTGSKFVFLHSRYHVVAWHTEGQIYDTCEITLADRAILFGVVVFLDIFVAASSVVKHSVLVTPS